MKASNDYYEFEPGPGAIIIFAIGNVMILLCILWYEYKDGLLPGSSSPQINQEHTCLRT